MFEFDVVGALAGGLVGTVVMSAMMTMVTDAGLTAIHRPHRWWSAR